MIIYFSVLFRMRNISENIFREELITLHLCLITFFPEIRAVHEIVRKNTPEAERPQMTTYDGACALHAG
jgi:hypothetical protein